MAPANSPDHGGYYDVFARICPSRAVLEHVTGRWGSLTLGALAGGPMRFNELRRRVDGVSQKILAQTLQTLERDGFVERTVFSTFPLHVEYSLTTLGQSVADLLLAFFTHLQGGMPEVLDAQKRYDERGKAGPADAGPAEVEQSISG